MRKLQICIAVLVLLTSSLVFSQTLADYVLETRGDTLVVKDYWDMNEANSLYNVLTLDAGAPAGRVYELKTGGYYPLANNPTTIQATVIVGQDDTRLVNNDNATAYPPLICGWTSEAGDNTGAMLFAHDLTVKNCNISPATAQLGLGWNFFDGQAADLQLTLDNCLFERTRWVFMATGAANVSWHIKDCYFVNMNGQPCRRNGGVIDVFNKQGTLLVENNTHIMAQGLMYKLRANQFTRVIFNHNTFVNMSSLVLLDLGSQTAVSTTNNIFVNCNVQPYGPVNLDTGEEDIDGQPIGIANVYPDTSVKGDRKYLLDNNVLVNDARLNDIAATCNTNLVNGSNEWVSQMITMNARTQGYFDDDATFPYFVEGTWYNEMPNFTDSKDLLTTQVDALKAFSIGTVDTASTDVMPDWRLVNTGDENYVFVDWPIPVDLSYDNAALLTGATGGFPVGDLNWFPTQKGTWMAQRDAEYTAIQAALDAGTTTPVNETMGNKSVEFKLQQNYPNPFNPTTAIEYTITNPGVVTLKVYDALGKEVATLVDGYKSANQVHHAEFDGSELSSGVYFYTLSSANFTQTNKMLLIK